MRVSIRQKGFTFIELVMFIIIVSVAVTAISLLFAQTVRHSADPLIRQQALAVAKAYFDEIVRKRWDELTPDGGGCIDTAVYVCEALWQPNTRYEIGDRVRPTLFNTHLYEVVAVTGTGRSDLSTEPTWPVGGGTVLDGDVTWLDLGIPAIGSDAGELRWQFDDVDDYHGINDSPPQFPDISDLADGQSPMPGYDGFRVTVTVANTTWEGINENDVKQVNLSVASPNGETLSFTLYRVNY